MSVGLVHDAPRGAARALDLTRITQRVHEGSVPLPMDTKVDSTGGQHEKAG